MALSPSIWQPLANEILEDEWFGESYRPETSFWVRWFEAWNNRRTLGRLSRLVFPGRRLLEIGVGSGSFLQAAQNDGFEVMGCDLSSAIATRVEHEYGITMHCGPLFEITGEARFDVIVMNHVLEHTANPVEFLSDVLRLLSPGGVVHIAVPNVACWEAKLSGWNSYEPYHLLYFTPETLRQSVLQAGMRADSVSTHESFSGWFLAVLRTLLGVNRGGQAISITTKREASTGGKSRHSLTEHAYRIAMVIAGGGTWPLRWLQARLHRGDEAICIARKVVDVR
ncbi:MAG: class I SAM-dependent methyltransferase [Methylococcaceae bacterium]|nr:class I SAM-dependent methyltransferase [Methylococcaceae bacterium]